MFGQSLPVSAIVSTIAGLVVGEVAVAVAKKVTTNEDALRLTGNVAHGLASIASGWAVNAIGGADVTGAAGQTVVTGMTATYHNEIMDFMAGRGRIPSLR